MTTLVYAEVLRFVYAISMRWPGALTRAALLALLGAVVFAAWRLREGAPRRPAASRGKHLVANGRPRRVSA